MRTGNTLRELGFIGIILVFFLTACEMNGIDSSSDSLGFALAISVMTFLSAFAGGAFPLFAKLDCKHRMLESMTSVSAGFLISAACLIVIPEGFEQYSKPIESTEIEEDDDHEIGIEDHEIDEDDDHENLLNHKGHFDHSIIAGLAILSGFVLMLITESLGFGHDIHEEHHDHVGGHAHHPSQLDGKRLARVVVIGLTIHSIADGMSIGAGLATGSHALTGALLISLLTHKVPAAFSLAVFSQHAQGNIRRTWRDLLIFSVATPLAIITTWTILGRLSNQILGLVLLFSSGTFIYVATVDVLPKVLQSNRRRQSALQVIMGCASLLFLIIMLDFLGFSIHDHK